MTQKAEQVQKVMNLVKTWIETESGPTHCGMSIPDLHLSIKIRGYKKIILERTFPKAIR